MSDSPTEPSPAAPTESRFSSRERPPVRSFTTELPPIRGAAAVARWLPWTAVDGAPHPWSLWRRAIRRNWDNVVDGWAVWQHGVCDVSPLCEAGQYDDVPGGTALSPERIERMVRHTLPYCPPADLLDVARLRRLSVDDLLALGRLSRPYLHRAGERGFGQVSWDEAWAAISAARGESGDVAVDVQLAGLCNERAWAVADGVRRLGARAVHGHGRLGHVAMRAISAGLGTAGSAGSLIDIPDAELVLVVGSSGPAAHPRLARLLVDAKRRGARVVQVNVTREPSLSTVFDGGDIRSAALGWRVADDALLVKPGGDAALFLGVLKVVCERDGVDAPFLRDRVDSDGWAEVRRSVEEMSWETILGAAGCARTDVEWLAELVVRADNAVTLVGTGVLGTATEEHVLNGIQWLHLCRGWLDRPGNAVLPLAANSGVVAAEWVGLADVGAADDAAAMHVVVGGCPGVSRRGASAVRVHFDTHLRPEMLDEAAGLTVLLPVTSALEHSGGTTFSSIDRRTVASPQTLSGVGRARDLSDVWAALAGMPDEAPCDSDAIRVQLQAVPHWLGIDRLAVAGDFVQAGGRTGFAGRAPTRFSPAVPRLPESTAGLRLSFRMSSLRLSTDRQGVGLSRDQLRQRGWQVGDIVRVTGPGGQWTGPAVEVEGPSEQVQVCWPEAAILALPGQPVGEVTVERRA